MVIGILTVKLHIPESQSLKTKRRSLRSLKDKLRSKFNISVAEVDSHEKWQIAVIAIAAISSDKQHCNSSLSNILNFIENFGQLDIIDHRLELL